MSRRLLDQGLFRVKGRITALWSIRKFAVCLSIMFVGGCAHDTTSPNTGDVTHVRIVNSLFQDNGTDSSAMAIDYLIDSATTLPSRFGIESHNVSTGDSANGYIALPAGVHSFVVRRVGDTTLTASLYTTSTDLPYLPKQFLTAGTYYTVIVAGIVPANGSIPNNTIPFVALVDDPFPGPTLHDVVQARFRIINAAPYASSDGTGGTVTVYVTPGSTVPDSITRYVPLGTVRYRNSGSAYINVDPGTYLITLRVSSQPVAQQPVTFAAGEVRTLVLQSTAAGPPSLANHVLTNLLDHQY